MKNMLQMYWIKLYIVKAVLQFVQYAKAKIQLVNFID